MKKIIITGILILGLNHSPSQAMEETITPNNANLALLDYREAEKKDAIEGYGMGYLCHSLQNSGFETSSELFNNDNKYEKTSDGEYTKKVDGEYVKLKNGEYINSIPTRGLTEFVPTPVFYLDKQIQPHNPLCPYIKDVGIFRYCGKSDHIWGLDEEILNNINQYKCINLSYKEPLSDLGQFENLLAILIYRYKWNL